MKRRIVTFLILLFATSTSLADANAEVVTFPCTGGTYSVEMPAATIIKANQCTGSFTIDPSVKRIGTDAFKFSKITSISIPNSVTSIDSGAFEYSDLNSVIIPNSVTTMGRYAFSGSKISAVTISSSLTNIEMSAFANTKNLTSVIIPVGVKIIEAFAFSYGGLTSVTIPNTVTNIEFLAFVGSKLVKVDIPDSTRLASSAFQDNTELKSIIYCGKDVYGLPTAPTCPADRKAIIDAAAKAAADKAAADKLAADAKAAADKLAADAKAKADRAAADAKAAADRAATQAAQDAKKLTITCLKGKKSKKVTGESPVCPKGFTNSLDKYLTFQAYSKCQLYKKDSSLAGVSLLDKGTTLKFSYAGKYSSYIASTASYADVACALSVMKAPSFVVSQIDTTRALDGLQRATWGKLSAFWTYHPDSGVNISFNSK
jgi:hypothetical protein